MKTQLQQMFHRVIRTHSLGWIVITLGLIALALGVSSGAQAQKETREENFWESTAGPYGIMLWSSLVTQDGTYYGGSGLGRIYRKLPSEDRWEIVKEMSSDILAFYEHGGRIYSGGPSMIYSADNGDTWAQVEGFPTDVQVRYIAENKLGELLVGTDRGIYRGVPGKNGETDWQFRELTTKYGSFVFTVCLDPVTGSVYAGSGRGIYRSDDDGDTWTSMGLDETANSIMGLAVSAVGDVYAGTSEGGMMIHRANDPDPKGWMPTTNAEMSSPVRRVSIVNGTEIFVSVTSLGLYHSSNAGVDWEKLLPYDSRGGTYLDPVTGRVITGTSQGFWTSRPPQEGPMVYQQIGIPLDVSRIYSFQSKIAVIADENRVIYRSEDRGETWTRKLSNGEGIVTCYAEKENKDIFVGMDGGITGKPWIQAEIFIESENQRGWWSIGFPDVVTQITDVLVTSKDSVYVGTDAGLYYIDSREYGSKRRSIIANNVTILDLAEDRAGNIYAATDKGLYISSDDGATWPTLVLGNTRVLELAMDGDHILAATSKGLYDIAPDRTAVLLPVGTVGTINSVTVDDHSHVYATAADGVYYAESRADVWAHQESGVESYDYWRLHTIDNMAYVTTNIGFYKHAYADLAEVNLEGLGAFSFNNTAHGATATTTPAGLPVKILYNGVEGAPVQGGSYQVIAIVDDENYAGRKQGRITISKIEATVALSGLGTYFYNGSPFSATATTTPPGLPVVMTYKDKEVPPVEIGEYYVKAVIDHPSYYGEAGGDLVIQDPIMGTEDAENGLVRVYPVPTRKGITVESGVDKIRSITVYNTLGKPIDQVSLATPVNRHVLETAAYPPGVLVVMITTDNHHRVVKRAELIR